MQNIELIIGGVILLVVIIVIVVIIMKKEKFKNIDFSLTHGNEGAGVTNVGNIIDYEHLYQLPPTELPYNKIRKNMLQLPEPTFRPDFYEEDYDPITNTFPSMYTGKKERLTDFVSETKRCGM